MLLVLVVLLSLAGGDDESLDRPSMAYTMCKKFVRQRLRAPSTADFPLRDESFVTSLGGGRYRVTAYVDAENGFGAKIRSTFVCLTSTADAGKTWRPDNVEILDR